MIQTINKHYILSNFNQLDIFAKYISMIKQFQGIKHYTSDDIKEYCITGKCFSSPLRTDRKPSVVLKYNFKNPNIIGNTDYYKYGKLEMRDYTVSTYSISERFYGDVFDFVRLLIQDGIDCSNFQAIVDHIYEIMSGTVNSEVVLQNVDSDNRKIIEIEIRDYNKGDLEKWGTWFINKETLLEHYVYACKTVWVNNRLVYSYKASDRAYAYYFGKDENGIDLYTIYFPDRDHSSKYRFIKNHSLWQGYFNLQPCKYLLFSKALKCTMAIRNIISYSLRDNTLIGVIAIPHEGYLIKPFHLEHFRKHFNVQHFISFFDNDFAGKRYTINVKNTFNEVKPFIIDKRYGVKDTCNYLERFGVDDTINQFKLILNKWKIL